MLSFRIKSGMTNVGLFVDGYNFYAGINHPRWLDLGWCNFLKLARHFAPEWPDSSGLNVYVKYFTSRVALGCEENAPRESQRQAMWLEALRLETGAVDIPAHWTFLPNNTRPAEVNIIFGRHIMRPGNQRQEKQTDVNLAVHLVLDAAYGYFDHAIVVSADTDFTSAIESVKRLGKGIAVRIPPNQADAFRAAGLSLTPRAVTRDDLTVCRLAESISRKNGPPLRWSDYQALT
jgi:uncharacterized LabA/DUF88 family protein